VESNWRYNVWALGMQHSDWRLAARIVSPLTLYLVNPTATAPNFYRIFRIVFPGTLPAQVGTIAIPGLFPRFPYGVDVLPD